MRTAFVIAIITGLAWVAPCAWAVPQGPVAAGGLTIDQMLSIAEKQHEIARLLIKEGQFERVLPEMRKILDLNLQGEYEKLVAQSASIIAHLLTENKQYILGHELLDETLARTQLTVNAASLLKIKAYIYKSEGKLPKAIETLERAVEIEKQQPSP